MAYDTISPCAAVVVPEHRPAPHGIEALIGSPEPGFDSDREKFRTRPGYQTQARSTQSS